MNKLQVILLVAAIALVALMYNLPKVVVDNESTEAQTFIDESEPSGVVDHSSEVPEEYKGGIRKLKSQLFVNETILDDSALLDSLMATYRVINLYDSAAFYAELSAKTFNTIESWQKAGDAYFEAFTFALDKAKVDLMGSKAKEAYDKVLEEQPENYDVQHNIAMTLVSSASPMQGIMMLRGILEKDPSNQKALMSMGRMSIQTGQFDNAVQRFESFVNYYPEDIEGNFFLAISYFETGQNVKAKTQFEKVKTLGASEQIVTAVNEYLERIN